MGAVVTFDLNEFLKGSERPVPPETLYKYLAPNLVKFVLEDGTAKFTQMANTNDMFEVRQTFERITGPRFRTLLDHQVTGFLDKKKLDKKFSEHLEKAAGKKLSRQMRRKALATGRKEHIFDQFKAEMKTQTDRLEAYMGREEATEQFIEMFGKDMLCFSLSERFDIPNLWGLYAESNSGFVIGFNADADWFKNKKDTSKTRLHKVQYFDGFNAEILDNPDVAFGSKTTTWSYEQEWRMYCGLDDIEITYPANPDPIYLITFPPEIVTSIIVGARARQDTIDGILRVAASKYPHAILLKAVPNRRTASYELEPLAV